MSIDALKAKYKDIITFASTPRERLHYTFTAPSLNWLASGGRDYRGIRSGTLIEFVGAKSSGKSTLALDLVSNAQQKDKMCMWIDIERWFDPTDVGDYAKSLGVDIDKLYMVRPKTTEQAFSIVMAGIDSGVDVIVIDSIAAAIPKDEWEKDFDDPERLGESAKLIKRLVQRTSIMADDSNTLVIALNQVRSNITSMAGAKATKRFGGKAYEHHLHQAYELTVTEHKDAEHWKRVSVFLEKNRIGGMERLKRDLIISYGKGIRSDLDIIDRAIQEGIITQNGKTWLYYGELKAAGRENASVQFPLEEIRKELEK